MLRNTLLIAKREYLERVRSKLFRVTTVLIPVGMAALAFFGGIGTKRIDRGVSSLAIVSNQPALAHQVRDALDNVEVPPKSVSIFAPATSSELTQLNQQVQNHQINGYLILNMEPGQSRPKATWVSGTATDFIGKAQMKQAVSDALVRQQLASRGMTDAQIRALTKEIDLATMQVKDGRAVASNAQRSFAGAYALILVLYAAVLFYGINVARSVVEEKTSRIFEVLLSTASADDLMLGKLLGVGAVGLTQMAIWAALVVLFAGSQLAARSGIHGLASIGLTPAELAFFPIYFVLGFFLYSGLAAALGSSVNGEQEVQQFSLIIISPLFVSVFLMLYVMSNPGSTASVVLSLIPPFTPLIMYMRICSQMPPLWQIGLSIALMVGSVLGMAWLAARIYRIGLLMYGKRATLPELLRWLKYS